MLGVGRFLRLHLHPSSSFHAYGGRKGTQILHRCDLGGLCASCCCKVRIAGWYAILRIALPSSSFPGESLCHGDQPTLPPARLIWNFRPITASSLSIAMN